MSINRPIPLCYKEGFEDMDLDHNGKLDAREVFNMMKTVGSLGTHLVGKTLTYPLWSISNNCLKRG